MPKVVPNHVQVFLVQAVDFPGNGPGNVKVQQSRHGLGCMALPACISLIAHPHSLQVYRSYRSYQMEQQLRQPGSSKVGKVPQRGSRQAG